MWDPSTATWWTFISGYTKPFLCFLKAFLNASRLVTACIDPNISHEAIINNRYQTLDKKLLVVLDSSTTPWWTFICGYTKPFLCFLNAFCNVKGLVTACLDPNIVNEVTINNRDQIIEEKLLIVWDTSTTPWWTFICGYTKPFLCFLKAF